MPIWCRISILARWEEKERFSSIEIWTWRRVFGSLKTGSACPNCNRHAVVRSQPMDRWDFNPSARFHTFQVLNMVHSYVTLQIPLYVSYISHSPTRIPWRHYDLNTDLRLTFVYDTAKMWTEGIGTPPESELPGKIAHIWTGRRVAW